METWVAEDGPGSKRRPSASVVLYRLKKDVEHWGKSILPLVPEEWQGSGGCSRCLSICRGLLTILLQRQVLMEEPVGQKLMVSDFRDRFNRSTVDMRH